MIITSLKDGFYIDYDLVKKAESYYQDCLKNKSIKNFLVKSHKIFEKETKKETKQVLNVLKKLQPIVDSKRGRYYYEPSIEF